MNRPGRSWRAAGWPVEAAIAWRYLRARRKGALISLISAIATLGVCLGVMALIIVIAVMAGMESDLRAKILGANAHVVVYKRSLRPIEAWRDVKARIETHEGLRLVDPFVFGKVMIRSPFAVEGVVVKGFDEGTPASRRRVGAILVKGALQVSPQDASVEEGTAAIYLGEELAYHLAVGVGDEVRLVSPFGQTTPAGFVPRSRTFRVAGLFHTGMYEYDSSWVYLPLDEAQRFFGMTGKISGLEIFLDDLDRARTLRDELQEMLGPGFYVQDWMDMNQNFFAALRLEKLAMFIILVLIVVVAAFNIVGTLTMMVMEKNRDIGILQAMGASRGLILRVFLLQGMTIGVVGTFVGAVLGAAVCWVADTYELVKLSGSVYYISHLPFKLAASDVVIIVGSSLLIAFLATIYPARQASRLDPVEAIRHE